MSASVVGRDAELAVIEEFLAGISDGASALVLEGEAGMGKTTLWSHALAAADERGHLVLRARPTESETTLSFAGLGDVLEPVLGGTLASLPAPQRRALSRALVLSDDEGPAPDPHAVGVAVQNVLRAAAAERPVVVAVDDVQWLDSASAGALGFAVRRLRDDRVGVLLSRRVPLESALLAELRHSLAESMLGTTEVGPLDPDALHAVIRTHLGVALPRPLLAEVQQTAGGNPFYALEIVRTLRRDSISVEAGRPLPVPESLHDVVQGRILALPSESRDFLAAAAAHAHPTIAITESASGISAELGLRPALDGQIVELDRDRIRFVHPLLAAGAYETADPVRRREIHVRLAELLDDIEARAWQLAASVDAPDDEVAAALEDAAHHARSRGALRPAALLLERAQQLTPGEEADAASRRAVDAARLHFESGDASRAIVQLEAVLTTTPTGVERARALALLGRVRLYEDWERAVELFEGAIQYAGGDRPTLAACYEGLAECCIRQQERLSQAVTYARRAVELALEIGDESLAAEAIGSQVLAETLLGRKSAAATQRKALELQERASELRVISQPLFSVAVSWAWGEELVRARAATVDLLSRANELGDESSVPYVLYLVGRIEVALGDLGSALERTVLGARLAEDTGQQTVFLYHRALGSLVDAMRGESGVRELAAAVLERATALGIREAQLLSCWALGYIELTAGNAAEAARHLRPSVEAVRRHAVAEPNETLFVADLVEAEIELGQGEQAAELLDWYEGQARRLKRRFALANCARCRGLLAAQAGNLDGALAAFDEALGWHAEAELPLDRGRTLLALGAAQRRLKRRREARATLEEALALFERIGAALWAERARGELARISGRAATPGALTPAEERVAALVAEGKTNKEVAAALYLSDRTVEGHLAHIFGKLGIRHRTELAAALQTRGIAPPNTGDSPVSAETLAP
jgi:DNA-binding CsgD family transcriptional regulator